MPALVGKVEQPAALGFMAGYNFLLQMGEILIRQLFECTAADAQKLSDIKHTCDMSKRIKTRRR